MAGDNIPGREKTLNYLRKFSVGMVSAVSLIVAAHSLHGQTPTVPPVPPTTASAPQKAPRVPLKQKAIYANLLGFWKGELTYRDYTTDKSVTLPTILEIALTPDGKKMLFHYTYDDGPGKQVEETNTIEIEPEQNIYCV